MIDRLRGLHTGKSFAIIGSAPTADLYQEKENVAIAVNGALQLDRQIDYFVTSHPMAHRKSWFFLRPEIPRIINSVSAIHYADMYPDKAVRAKLHAEYEASMVHQHQADEETGECFNVLFRKLPEPARPHSFFYFGDLGVDPLKNISPLQDDIFAGGTSACSALQIANIMGAREIHLYGCSFSNDSSVPFKGNNYFYKPKAGEMGQTKEEQRQFMDLAIRKIMNGGTPVYVHGFTNLKEPIKIG